MKMIVLALCFVLAGCSPAQKVSVGPVVSAPLPKIQSAIKTEPPKTAQVKVVYVPSEEIQSTHDTSGKWIEINLFHGKGKLQHFTAYEGTKAVFSGLVSGAVTDIDMPANRHPDFPHNHLGWFSSHEKDKDYWSKENNCPMPNSVFYANGHGHAVHSCQRKDIILLGHPASHGCTRTSPANSVKLFNWVGDVKHHPVPVHIIRE